MEGNNGRLQWLARDVRLRGPNESSNLRPTVQHTSSNRLSYEGHRTRHWTIESFEQMVASIRCCVSSVEILMSLEQCLHPCSYNQHRPAENWVRIFCFLVRRNWGFHSPGIAKESLLSGHLGHLYVCMKLTERLVKGLHCCTVPSPCREVSANDLRRYELGCRASGI